MATKPTRSKKPAAKPSETAVPKNASKVRRVSAPQFVEIEGYQYQRIGSSFGTLWDPKKAGEELRGIVTSKKEVPNKLATRKDQKKTQWVVEVTDDKGIARTIWESSGTAEWCQEVVIGDRVLVRYQGIVPLKGGKKFKALDCYIADRDAAPKVVRANRTRGSQEL